LHGLTQLHVMDGRRKSCVIAKGPKVITDGKIE
jgi:hypothetical protein